MPPFFFLKLTELQEMKQKNEQARKQMILERIKAKNDDYMEKGILRNAESISETKEKRKIGLFEFVRHFTLGKFENSNSLLWLWFSNR